MLRAVAVHFLTSLGALCGLFALHYTAEKNWQAVFALLALALIIDGVDGPLARRVDIKQRLPRFSGERLDLIIDYLTYVIVPAYMLLNSSFLDPAFRECAAGLIALSSLYHFSDQMSKTQDGYFVGFPANWNVVVLYIFTFQLPSVVNFAVICAFVLLTFIPVRWIHPVRVSNLRWLSLILGVLWFALAAWIVAHDFAVSNSFKFIFLAIAFYFSALGLGASILSRRRENIANI